ncbi:hypothetical protein MBLNU457_g2978t1 [Dothideomycetes sp. NU457]
MSSERVSVAVLLEGNEVLFVELELGGEILQSGTRKLRSPASSITVNSNKRAAAYGNAKGIELHRHFDEKTSNSSDILQFLKPSPEAASTNTLRLMASPRWSEHRVNEDSNFGNRVLSRLLPLRSSTDTVQRER